MGMQDQVIVITGASRGIGAAAALAFAAQGARVALIARDRAGLADVAGQIGAEAMAVAADVARWDDMARAVAQVQAAWGRVDVLVNNAGVVAPMAAMDVADPGEWATLIDINVKGVFHGIRAVLPGMLAQGAGAVLTLSSGAAHHPVQGWSAYCASKAGAAMLTESLHLERSGQGIRAMGLSPGTVATDMQRQIKESGVGPVAALDWDVHIPSDWPARALVWMCGPAADEYVGQELSLREADLRRRIGLI